MKLIFIFMIIILQASQGFAQAWNDIHKDEQCWFYLYKWADYNQKGGFGTGQIIIKPGMILEVEKVKETVKILKTMPKENNVEITKISRIACK